MGLCKLKHITISISFSFSIWSSNSIVLSRPVCVGRDVLGHILSQLALWRRDRGGVFHPGGDIQDTVVSTRQTISGMFFKCNAAVCMNINDSFFTLFLAAVMGRKWSRLLTQISTKTRRCTLRYEN